MKSHSHFQFGAMALDDWCNGNITRAANEDFSTNKKSCILNLHIRILQLH